MRLFLEKLNQILPQLFDLQTLKAILTWPKFSIASYIIVSSLKKQEIFPKTIIDVGANMGQFSIAAVKLFTGAKIYAFEPNPECALKLQANVSNLAGIDIRNIAIGHKNGTADFYINCYDQASSLLPLNNDIPYEYGHLKESKKINVNISTLDKIFKHRTLEKPVLLKLDVQGYEKYVIEGGHETLKKVDYVLLEASFFPMYVGEPTFLEIIEVMNTIDFRFVRPIAFMKNPKNGEILQTDILFKRANRQFDDQ